MRYADADMERPVVEAQLDRRSRPGRCLGDRVRAEHEGADHEQRPALADDVERLGHAAEQE